MRELLVYFTTRKESLITFFKRLSRWAGSQFNKKLFNNLAISLFQKKKINIKEYLKVDSVMNTYDLRLKYGLEEEPFKQNGLFQNIYR